jgi:peptidase M48-like protein
MIFDEPTLANVLQDRSVQRVDFVSRLVTAAKALFPQIDIRLLESIAVVNAQASMLGKRQTVDLFGGLMFHRALGPDALTFALAHELGHHVATGARQNCGSVLACDCAADAWASTIGFALLSASRATPSVHRALKELGSVLNAQNRKQVSLRRREAKCWALDWSQRERVLGAGKFRRIKKCDLFEIIQGRK